MNKMCAKFKICSESAMTIKKVLTNFVSIISFMFQLNKE